MEGANHEISATQTILFYAKLGHCRLGFDSHSCTDPILAVHAFWVVLVAHILLSLGNMLKEL